MEEFKGRRITSVDRRKENYKRMRKNSGSNNKRILSSLLELKRHAKGLVRIKQDLFL